tara:strand:+ start:336 stop:1331 length:996 start_codon:yes stop_codon:yes gene_type:complete
MNYDDFKNILGECKTSFIDNSSLFSVKNRCRKNGLYDNNKIIGFVKKHNDEIDNKELFIHNLNVSDDYDKFITTPVFSRSIYTRYIESFVLNDFDCLFDSKAKEFEAKMKEIFCDYVSKNVFIFDKENKIIKEKDLSFLEQKDFENIVIHLCKQNNLFFYDLNKKYPYSFNSAAFDILFDITNQFPVEEYSFLFKETVFYNISSDFCDFFIDEVLDSQQRDIFFKQGQKDFQINAICQQYKIPNLTFENQGKLRKENSKMCDNYFNKFYDLDAELCFSRFVFDKIKNMFNKYDSKIDLSYEEIYAAYFKNFKDFEDKEIYFNLNLINEKKV